MKPRTLLALVVAGSLTVGCGSGKGLPSPTGSGGGSGGMLDGVGGSTGGSTGGAAGSGGGLDGAVCDAPGTLRSIPWKLVMPDAGTSTGAAGADAAVSGCQGTGSGYSWDGTCSGAAWLHAVGDAPTVTWDDGAQMVWSVANLGQPLESPAVESADTRVWASFTQHYHVTCPFCGATTTEVLELRESAGGKLLFLGQTGPNLPDPGAEQLMALFGVPADTRALCTRNDTDGCTRTLLTINDHLVHTAPAQVIPPSLVTTVNAPNGLIQLYWTSSVEQQLGSVPNCADGVPTGPWMTFVGSRIRAAATTVP